MSLTSYRAAPPRGGGWDEVAGEGGGWRTWRRPTLPRLGAQYHGRGGVSRPSSGWGRVGHPRCRPPGRAAAPPGRASPRGRAGPGRSGRWVGRGRRGRSGVRAARAPWGGAVAAGGVEVVRAVRTGQLRASPRVHTRPIDVVVSHGPWLRGLVLGGASRLDAFSGYPARAWPPGCAAGATTGPPEARPPRSSRTGGGSPQASDARGR